MKGLRDVAILALGALIAYIVIVGINLNIRMSNAEKNIMSIVQAINQANQPKQPAAQPVEMK